MRKRTLIVIGIAGLLVIATPATASRNRLVATVGPMSVISLTSPSGAAVNRLRRGTYDIVVRDRSRRESFHLFGPTARSLLRPVNKKTTLRYVGTTKWTVRLRPGVYRFYSDARRASLRGSFRVI